MIYFLLSGFLIAILLGSIIIPNILLISYKKRLFDIPDSRKIHSLPIPRLGGLSFLPVVIVCLCLIMGMRYYLGFPIRDYPVIEILCEFLFFAVGAMFLYLVGVADDLIGVGYRYKFMVQIIAALLLIASGDSFHSLGGIFGIYELPAWLGIPFTVFVVVYIINAINLIDGIDGLASGLTSISLCVLGLIYTLRGEYIYAILAFTTLGVLIPFWIYNVFGNAKRGHKLFMGDAGSLTLGYILSLLVIHLSVSRLDDGSAGTPYMMIAFSTILVPLFDVVRVVLHRLRAHKSPFLPDKNHFHHKLLRTGMSVRMVMLTILGVSLFFIALNWVLMDIGATPLLLLDIVLWTVLQLLINSAIRRHTKQINSPSKN